MDVLIRENLRNLMTERDGAHVTIYMPTHRAGRQTQELPIQLKNRLDEAEELLEERGLRKPEIQKILEPARRLVEDPLFWEAQEDGLVFFLARDFNQTYRLPLDFESLVVVGDTFHVKPLLPILSGTGQFFILALSQEEIRLFHGTQYSIRELEPEELPESLSEVMLDKGWEKHMQFHTGTRTPGGKGGELPASYHGQGGYSRDDLKDDILRYFHRVDKGVEELLGTEQIPLVLAGVEFLHPIYEEANTYPHLFKEGITGNPERWSAQELHEKAWPLVEPLYQENREDAENVYNRLSGMDHERAVNTVEEAVPAAYFERINVLFVPLERQIWGTFDPETGEVEVHEEQQPGDEDMLSFAAVHTLLNGGMAFVVDPEEMPDTPLAAVLRF